MLSMNKIAGIKKTLHVIFTFFIYLVNWGSTHELGVIVTLKTLFVVNY